MEIRANLFKYLHQNKNVLLVVQKYDNAPKRVCSRSSVKSLSSKIIIRTMYIET